MTTPLPYFGLTRQLVVVDAETCSSVDLPKCGSDRYFASTSTRTLMVGFQVFEAPVVHLWQPHQGAAPAMLRQFADAPPEDTLLVAFNAAFDRQALAKAGLETPPEKWLDLQLLSYLLAFAGGLDDVLKQFEVVGPDSKPLGKNAEGKRLITLFSKQMTPWFNDPAAWHRFVGYCRQDVEVETALLHKCLQWLNQAYLRPQVQVAHRQWLLDQRMNARGMPVSEAMVRGALDIKRVETERLAARIRDLTGGCNPNSVQQLAKWLTDQGHPLPDLQAATVREALGTIPEDHPAHEVLRHRIDVNRKSVKKYDSLSKMVVGGRIRNGTTTYGASRTGRTASRGLNLTNLERPKFKKQPGQDDDALVDDMNFTADLIELGNADTLALWRPASASRMTTMGILGSSIRGAIKAPGGLGISAIDLKSIESVGLAWLAGCDTILDLFHEGKDTYKEFATRYYGIPYDRVTGEQRSFCKPPVLGCLAEGTKVLTDHGWKAITDVQANDLLWDGIAWATHGGVVFQGTKETLTWNGVSATPDHLFLCREGWKPWKEITDGSLKLVKSSAFGRLLGTAQKRPGTYANAEDAKQLKSSPWITFAEAKPSLAYNALTHVLRATGRLLLVSKYVKRIAIGSLTGFTQQINDARTKSISITKGMERGALNAVLRESLLSSTLSRYLGGITRLSNWIELTTTAIMRLGIFDLFLGEGRTLIEATTLESIIWEECTPRQSFIENLLRSTVIKALLQERSTPDGLRKTLSKAKARAKVRTYDILNAGPRNRFTVLSDEGPVIAHNCGYGASGPALVTYAAGMGVTLTDEVAAEMVRVFRTGYPEIPTYWRTVDAAAKNAIRYPGEVHHAYPSGRSYPVVSYYYDRTFLQCRLPSGRSLFYYKPAIEKRTITKRDGDTFETESLCYWGKKQDEGGRWMWLSTHGAKVVENLVQAMCRDILYHALDRIDQDPEIELIGSTYDEAITLTPTDHRAPAIWQRLVEHMTTKPSWLDDRFFLGADGYLNAKRYRK